MDEKKESGNEMQFDLEMGGLFKGIGNFVGLIAKLAEEGGSVLTKEGEIKGLDQLHRARGVYGFSVRVGGLDEGLKVESFGNIRQTESGPVVEEVREPLVDVFEEGEEVSVVAELPGVEEGGIQIDVEGDILTIAAQDGGRKYSKEVLLPASVEGSKMRSSYKNGVLEIRIPKAGGASATG